MPGQCLVLIDHWPMLGLRLTSPSLELRLPWTLAVLAVVRPPRRRRILTSTVLAASRAWPPVHAGFTSDAGAEATWWRRPASSRYYRARCCQQTVRAAGVMMALIGLTLAFEWAAVIGLAGLVITSAQAIGEGTTDPVLIIWLMIVETSSNLAFCVISNAIAGFIARSPARARSPYAPAGPRR